jgi:uncharacterized alkaline shock family protein YloU
MAKMFDRVLLFIYSVTIAFATIILLSMSFAWIDYDLSVNYLDNLYREPMVRNIFVGISIAFLLFSCRLVYLSIRANNRRLPSIDQRTDFGDIRISFDTVQSLAMRAAGRIRGLGEIKARIHVNDSGLEVELRVVVDGEHSIPQLTEEAQRTVKDHIEEMTGIPVANISIFVSNVSTTSSSTFKARVE